MNIPKLISIEPVYGKRLRLTYETGEVKMFDVKPYISGAWYGELSDPAYFNGVQLLSDGTGIEWQNGQDIAPHELYENGTSELFSDIKEGLQEAIEYEKGNLAAKVYDVRGEKE